MSVISTAAAVLASTYVVGTLVKKRRRRQMPTPLALGMPFPRRPYGVSFAIGTAEPAWPLDSTSKKTQRCGVSYFDADNKIHGRYARRFGAARDGKHCLRRHAGVDLFANIGDTVLATEAGILARAYDFHLGTWMLIEQGDSGLVILYGEIEPKSWRALDLKIGDRVEKGQPIARVGAMNTGRVDENGQPVYSHMLHIETNTQGLTENLQWCAADPAPVGLLNPTLYLLKARLNCAAKQAA